MKIPFADLKKEHKLIKEELEKAIENVFAKGNYILGENVREFEKEWAKYLGAKYCFTVGNGTDALFLSLKALGIKEGDEVIVPDFTFVATAFAVSNTGATPVFVDVGIDSYNINPKEIESKISEKTKAIIVVHIYGNPADMDSILKIAKKYKLLVIEDAAQAHGAVYKNKKVGTIGDIGCFSFYPTKNLGCYGDAGAIVTNNTLIANKIMLLRNYGEGKKYYSEIIGYNSRTDEVQAAILHVKLKNLDKWNELRKEKVKLYKKFLKDCVSFQKEENSVYHIFSIRTKNRNSLMSALGREGVSSLIHYPVPLHMQKAYRDLGYKKTDFPVSLEIAKTEISLPIYPFLTEREISYIANIINGRDRNDI